MILIPSIDLRNGRCVRLLKGDFDAETRYDLEPHELLLRYRALGASWLHVVDLDGAKDGRLANRSVIVRLASQRALHIQVGGGVRSRGRRRRSAAQWHRPRDRRQRRGRDTRPRSQALAQAIRRREDRPRVRRAPRRATAFRACSRAAGRRNRSSRCGRPSTPIYRTASSTCCAPTSSCDGALPGPAVGLVRRGA